MHSNSTAWANVVDAAVELKFDSTAASHRTRPVVGAWAIGLIFNQPTAHVKL
jgi:hypothetical protein